MIFSLNCSCIGLFSQDNKLILLLFISKNLNSLLSNKCSNGFKYVKLFLFRYKFFNCVWSDKSISVNWLFERFILFNLSNPFILMDVNLFPFTYKDSKFLRDRTSISSI